ncbi:carbohydrate sulfotransferase 10-like [Portunus trituberculatus]|uniref:carbohydrate sulfotransferase 10-like n=1 Tax=Portunus trituberculatus TaxID=210409 RepID=UPI001E1CC8B9|nr:carbohydrate sulfotransferase 10-like [Portunus trituberculatus]
MDSKSFRVKMASEQWCRTSYGHKSTGSALYWGWILPLHFFGGTWRLGCGAKVMITAAILILGAGLVSVLSTTSLETEIMEIIGQRMVQRSARVERMCQRYSTSLLQQYSMWVGTPANWTSVNQSLSYLDLLVHRYHRLIWCKVPKVASTSLVHGFLRVLGRDDLIQSVPRGQLHSVIRNLMPHPSPQEDLSSFTAFLVVRHPFQRLLSAYRDKLLNRLEHTQFSWFRDQYGSSIIQNHRRHPKPQRYQDVPTFREFVEYLIVTPVWEYNEHWRPYYMTCAPCHQRYSIIMKLDSIELESNYLVHITGLPELSPKHVHATINTSYAYPSLRNRNKKFQLSDFHIQRLHHKDRTGASDSDIESSFFSDLNMQLLMKLYSVYKIDFEMFDFSISPYDKYVQMNKKSKFSFIYFLPSGFFMKINELKEVLFWYHLSERPPARDPLPRVRKLFLYSDRDQDSNPCA